MTRKLTTTIRELKYCERCGGLWIRPRDSQQSTCAGCRRELQMTPRDLAERLLRASPMPPWQASAFLAEVRS